MLTTVKLVPRTISNPDVNVSSHSWLNLTACKSVIGIPIYHNQNSETKYAPSSLGRSIYFRSISWRVVFPGFINLINIKHTTLPESKHQQRFYTKTDSASWAQTKKEFINSIGLLTKSKTWFNSSTCDFPVVKTCGDIFICSGLPSSVPPQHHVRIHLNTGCDTHERARTYKKQPVGSM